jgi:hypothetical protein
LTLEPVGDADHGATGRDHEAQAQIISEAEH